MREFVVKGFAARMRYHDLPGPGMPVIFIHGLGCAGSFDYPEVAGQPVLAIGASWWTSWGRVSATNPRILAIPCRTTRHILRIS
jgi:pimeloyl-ACP methyl ester carboxylesterase